MNQKAARLLRHVYRYDQKMTPKNLKRFWRSLHWRARTVLGEKMRLFIAKAKFAKTQRS